MKIISCNNCGFELPGQRKPPISPLPEIAGPPTDSQRALILEALEDMLPDRDRLDQEIAGVRDLLNQLLHERRLLSHRIAFHSALLAPVRRVPPEIMSEIFVRYAHDAYDTEPPRNHNSLVLATVCRSWRAVALSTPELWSRLEIRCGTYWPPSEMEMVEEWLTRSGAHPLSLKLRTMTTWPSNKWVEIFQSSQSRWRHVEFFLNEPAPKRLSAFKFCFQQLYTLEMHYRPGIGNASHLDMFEEAPMLHTVKINANPHLLRLPWRQLTCVHILPSTCAVNDVFETLTRCRDLVECKFRVYSQESDHPVLPSIQLPWLRTLEIRFKECAFLFDALTLPALQNIKIFAEWNQLPEFYSHFLPFLTRSNCPLRSLCLRGARLTDNQLLRVLTLLPGLIELEVIYKHYDPTITDAVLKALSSIQSEDGRISGLLPILENLSLHCSDRFTFPLFADFVRSRWIGRQGSRGSGGNTQLRRVRVYLYGDVKQDATSWADTLQAEGLDIILARDPEYVPRSFNFFGRR
jgi:hypothetical protein